MSFCRLDVPAVHLSTESRTDTAMLRAWHRLKHTERLERRRTTIILPKLMMGVKSENRYSNTMATIYDIHIFRRILESPRDEVIIDCIKLYNEGIHKQYLSHNIIGHIKLSKR